MFLSNINFLGVVVAAVANIVLGMIWYSPKVFGTTWMRLSGVMPVDKETAKKEMIKGSVLNFINAFIMIAVLGSVISRFNAFFVADAIKVAIWIWLGFIAAASAGMVIWEKKPLKLFGIHAGYHLAALIISAVILALVG